MDLVLMSRRGFGCCFVLMRRVLWKTASLGELRGTRRPGRYELLEISGGTPREIKRGEVVGKNSNGKLHYQSEYLSYFSHTTFGSLLSGISVFPFGYPKNQWCYMDCAAFHNIY